MVIDVAKVQLTDAIKELYQALVATLNRGAQLVAVHVKIVKQTYETLFGFVSTRRILDISEHLFKSLVQVFVLCSSGSNIAKQFRRQQEETLFLDKALSRFLRCFIRELSIVEIFVSRLDFSSVDVVCQVLRYVTIKHGAKDIAFEFPAADTASELISHCPFTPLSPSLV